MRSEEEVTRVRARSEDDLEFDPDAISLRIQGKDAKSRITVHIKKVRFEKKGTLHKTWTVLE